MGNFYLLENSTLESVKEICVWICTLCFIQIAHECYFSANRMSCISPMHWFSFAHSRAFISLSRPLSFWPSPSCLRYHFVVSILNAAMTILCGLSVRLVCIALCSISRLMPKSKSISGLTTRFDTRYKILSSVVEDLMNTLVFFFFLDKSTPVTATPMHTPVPIASNVLEGTFTDICRYDAMLDTEYMYLTLV